MRKSVHKDILRFLSSVSGGSPQGHYLSRLTLMASLIEGCLRSKRCTLESLSQPCPHYAARKKNSFLQQAKRWLGNKWVDWEFYFLPLARHFLGQLAAARGELVFIIDGSQTGKTHTCLMLSVLCRGFAVPVAWTVKKGEKGHFPEAMHLDLLKMVHRALPKNCRVILLGDGEFDGAQLRAWCFEQGWEFALRTSHDRLVDCGGEQAPLNTLSPTPGHRTFFVPSALADGTNALCWHEKRFEKPIFLLTNLEVANMACRYYTRRFKIETLFKQLKSKGFQLHQTQLKEGRKISNLIIVVATAFLLTYCFGWTLKKNTPEAELEIFARKDKLPKIGAICIAQLALTEAFALAIVFFSNLSKNFDWVFT